MSGADAVDAFESQTETCAVLAVGFLTSTYW
jgi:hypothetical protein